MMVEQRKTYQEEHRDDYHGTPVKDPFRWLEDPEDAKTEQWVNIQNQKTGKYLEADPLYDQIYTRLSDIWHRTQCSIPVYRGGHYFYWKRDPDHNQSILFMKQGKSGDPIAILDPNRMSHDHSISIADDTVNYDGTKIAYALSKKGSDWHDILIRDVATGQDLPEVLRWCRFSWIAWRFDNKGFYYNRYPDPETVSIEDQTAYCRVYYHQLGTPQVEDILVIENLADKDVGYLPQISSDGNYLVINVFRGLSPRNASYYRPIDSRIDFLPVIDSFDANYQFIGNRGTLFYYLTDQDAPNYQIIGVDITRPESEDWIEVIGETDDVIYQVILVHDYLILSTMQNACYNLKLYTIAGKYVKTIDLPSLGSISQLSGLPGDDRFLFGFTSFLQPEQPYQYDLLEHTCSSLFDLGMPLDPSDFIITQKKYLSDDKTPISIFLIHHKDVKNDGSNSVLLTGYGGFGISITPIYEKHCIFWLLQGGILAVPNIRGGGEFGRDWHQSGVLEKKQNVFNDFIKAAEWLISENYCRADNLAIFGRSNGGLLVTATMLQRPDLFGTVVCEVPLTDMLRYHKFTIGRYWIPEYGDAEHVPEHFTFLYAYSPLHNIVPDQKYPPILVMASDTDDRVPSLHAKKFVATLLSKSAPDNTVLLRIDTSTGHGFNKPRDRDIDDKTAMYTFIFKQFNLKLL